MNRPSSIIRFEQFYGGYISVAMASAVVNWPAFSASPDLQRATETIGAFYFPTVMAASFGLPLLLWYFSGHRRSAIARWIIFALCAANLAALMIALASGRYPDGLVGALGALGTMMYVAAAAMLFQPDARRWFGKSAI